MRLDKRAWKALRDELHEFPRPSVDSFISAVRIIVALYDIAPRPRRRRERRKELEHLKRATEAYFDQLKSADIPEDENMAAHGQSIGRMVKVLEEAGGSLQRAEEIRNARMEREAQKFKRALEAGETTLEAFVEAMHKATPEQPPLIAATVGALNAVSLLLDELEHELQKPIPIDSGRPTADADGLVTQLRFAYERHLKKKPKATKNGTFYNIAVIVTGQETPDRSVQAAIRAEVNPQNLPTD